MVGRKLVKLSKILKLNVTTTSSFNDFTYLENLNATCLDYNETVYLDKFDYIIDTSGKNSLSKNVSLLNENGKIILITTPSSTKFDAWDFYTNNKQIIGFVLSKAPLDKLTKAAAFMNEYYEKGYFIHDDTEILPYAKIKNYHTYLDNKKRFKTKPVFTFK